MASELRKILLSHSGMDTEATGKWKRSSKGSQWRARHGIEDPPQAQVPAGSWQQGATGTWARSEQDSGAAGTEWGESRSWRH